MLNIEWCRCDSGCTCCSCVIYISYGLNSYSHARQFRANFSVTEYCMYLWNLSFIVCQVALYLFTVSDNVFPLCTAHLCQLANWEKKTSVPFNNYDLKLH